MKGSLFLRAFIPKTTAHQVYEAWMDSRKHAEFTGETVDIQPYVGGKFLIAGSYISGKNIELEPYHRIFQTWRTTDFPENAPDSKLEISLTDSTDDCHVVLSQEDLPEDQVDSYRSGWMEYYFNPMIEYFTKNMTNNPVLE
jgi:uncharacterized protein YndB with AHSA1/START domain